MKYTFPEINSTRDFNQRVQKIQDELNELKEATDENHIDEELIDVLHTVETLMRYRFKGRKNILDFRIKQVIAKNYKRGYYSKTKAVF